MRRGRRETLTGHSEKQLFFKSEKQKVETSKEAEAMGAQS
jgi:hypothetical protein